MQQDVFATRVYVVGEVIVSLVALGGGFGLLVLASDSSIHLVASGLISAVTVFWFQRRAAEQANNAVTTIANGKLSTMMTQLETIQKQTASPLPTTPPLHTP